MHIINNNLITQSFTARANLITQSYTTQASNKEVTHYTCVRKHIHSCEDMHIHRVTNSLEVFRSSSIEIDSHNFQNFNQQFIKCLLFPNLIKEWISQVMTIQLLDKCNSWIEKKYSYIPHANLPPAFPVVELSSCPPIDAKNNRDGEEMLRTSKKQSSSK